MHQFVAFDNTLRKSMFRDSRSRSRSSHSMTSERSQKEEADAPQSSSVYVTFLPEDVTEEDMADVFEGCGTIKRINIKRKDDGFTFGFVDYDSPKQASRAVEACHRKKIKGKIINVRLSNPPKKEGGRGGFEQKGGRDFGDKKGFGGKKFEDRKREPDNERSGRDNRGGRDNNRDNRGGERRPMKCFKCQEEGHMSRNCPSQGGEQRHHESRPRNQGPSQPQKKQKVDMDFDDY